MATDVLVAKHHLSESRSIVDKPSWICPAAIPKYPGQVEEAYSDSSATREVGAELESVMSR